MAKEMNTLDFGIRRVRVTKLFGLYDYTLPGSGSMGSLVILYGDNGSGKTTLLKMIFHLLSAADDRGHRGALFKLPFKALVVDVANDIELEARRPGDRLVGPMILTIRSGGRLIARWDHVPRRARETEELDADGQRAAIATHRLIRQLAPDFEYSSFDIQKRLAVARINPDNAELIHPFFASDVCHAQYIRHLKELRSSLYLMTADRELTSDDLPKDSDDSPEDILARVRRQANDQPDDIATRRDQYLSQALGEAYRWIGQRAVTGTNVGSQNANDWYLHLIRSVVTHTTDPNVPTIQQMQDSLAKLDERAVKLSQHELFSTFNSRDLITLVNQAQKTGQQATIEPILAAFINGIRTRLEALEPTYIHLSTLLEIVNGMFSGKSLQFALTKGFYLVDVNARELEVSQLSSGEKHLLLILLRALVASDKPTIFLIDEPEISLNVKWQRRLLTELERMIGDKPMQLVFATHSIELLAQHSNSVAQLLNENQTPAPRASTP